MKLLFSPAFWVAMMLLAIASLAAYASEVLMDNALLNKQNTQLQADAKQLEAERARGDALTSALLTSQSQIDQLTQEAHRAITTQTTGRACLGHPALRVLSRAPGITVAIAAPSSTAAADGATTGATDDAGPDSGDPSGESEDEYATDTQLASWAIDAAAQFETCRNRLDKLIDWHEKP